MIRFQSYTEADYDAVCDFLIALNRNDRDHINWNWARFEWMVGHPEFDREAASSIGLWISGGKVAGAAIYDMYFGEAFCGVLPEHERLYPEILDYAYRELKDDAGLGIAICDGNAKELEAAGRAGFAPDGQTETVMKLELSHPFAAKLPDGFRAVPLDPAKEADAFRWLLWQGFDHGGDRAEFEREDRIAHRRRGHLRTDLSLAAVAPNGEYAAYCCLWYHESTDYAYIEPVCTVPAWRGRGAAKALLFTALDRARALGAKSTYVISDMAFYRKLGFLEDRRFRFCRRA